jgi:hypothetical protein
MECLPVNTRKDYLKKSWPWIQTLLIFIVVGYFGQKLSQGWVEHRAVLSHFDGGFFLLAMLVLAMAFPLLPVASKLTAGLFKVDLSMKTSFQNYFYSQAGKYLPGGIWSYLGRVYLFHKEGISKRLAFSITLLELLFLCVSGAFCFLISVYFWKQVPDFLLMLSILAFFAASLCALFPFYQNMPSKILNRLGLHTGLSFRPKKFGFILVIYVFFWELVGLGFYYLTLALGPSPSNMILLFAGIYPLAWMMGKLIFFMPAGIGVRESALVYLLGFFLSTSQSLWVSVVSRIWWIAAEVLCATMVLAWSQLSRNKT